VRRPSPPLYLPSREALLIHTSIVTCALGGHRGLSWNPRPRQWTHRNLGRVSPWNDLPLTLLLDSIRYFSRVSPGLHETHRTVSRHDLLMFVGGESCHSPYLLSPALSPSIC
jgi:hypothetical protein